MELVYLWVNNYKNIKEKGFNFSPYYRFTNNNYNLNKKEFNCKNIFGDNLNITAIAGENGSGKSSILEYIHEISNRIEDNETSYDFLIYKENELYIQGDDYCILNKNDDFKYDSNTSTSLITINNIVKNDEPQEKSFIFKMVKILSKKPDILKYFNNKFIFKKIKINIKRDDLLHFEHKNTFFIELKNKIISLIKSNIKRPKYNSEFSRYNNELMFSTHNIEYEIKISFLIKYLYYLIESFDYEDENRLNFLKDEKEYFKNLTFDNMFYLIENFDGKINQKQIFNTYINEEVALYKQLIELLKIEKKIKMKSKYRYQKTVSTKYETSIIYNVEKDSNKLFQIIEILSSSKFDYSSFHECFDFELLSYDNEISFSELSSGEQDLINKYILIIYEMLFNYSNIILIDEPDSLLHPNWAKKFIYKLVNIINNDSFLKEKKVHLIFTTHSPFILSDLPKENIIFLENGEQVYPFKKNEQTFGSNIHTLLSHGFFMEDGLMGEFAKSKINEVINNLNDKSNSLSKKQIKSMIDIVGEAFLKSKLEQMYNEKYGIDDELEELIKQQDEINLKIEKLKKQTSEDA